MTSCGSQYIKSYKVTSPCGFVMAIFIVGSVAGRFYITDLEGLEYAVRLPTLA